VSFREIKLQPLTPGEKSMAKSHALLVDSYSGEEGLTNKAMKRPSYELLVIGFGAEIAVCKYFNVYWEPVIGDDQGIDFMLNGLIVDIKSSDQHKYLMAPSHKKMKSDIYMSVYFKENVYTVMGWATKEEFEKASVKMMACSTRYILKCYLHDIEPPVPTERVDGFKERLQKIGGSIVYT